MIKNPQLDKNRNSQAAVTLPQTLAVSAYLVIWFLFGVIPVLQKNTIWLSLAFAVLLIVIIVGFLHTHQWNFKELFNISWVQVAKALATGLALVAIEVGVLVCLQVISHHTTTSANTALILKTIEKQPLFVGYTVLVAPALEEFIFRKCLNNCAMSIFSRMKLSNTAQLFWSWLLTSYVFASLHGDKSILFYLIFGFVLQFLYYRSENLRFTMIVHAVFNTASLMIMFV